MTPVWLVLPDPFSTRLFFDTGIVDGLRDHVGARLELFLDAGEQGWAKRAPAVPITRPAFGRPTTESPSRFANP